MKVQIKRVPYGKKDTPEELREYTIVGSGSSAVGTEEEIKNHFLDSLNVHVELEVIE